MFVKVYFTATSLLIQNLMWITSCYERHRPLFSLHIYKTIQCFSFSMLLVLVLESVFLLNRVSVIRTWYDVWLVLASLWSYIHSPRFHNTIRDRHGCGCSPPLRTSEKGDTPRRAVVNEMSTVLLQIFCFSPNKKEGGSRFHGHITFSEEISLVLIDVRGGRW